MSESVFHNCHLEKFKQMKRLFTIGSSFFIYSLVPILSWILLSVILKDENVVNVFSLTYPVQFIWAFVRSFFGTAANVKKNKENDENAPWNGIFWGTIFSFIVFSIPLIFVDKYIVFFGQSVDVYRDYVFYSIAQIFLQTLFSLITEKLYFEDKEKIANVHFVCFNILNLFLVTGLALFVKNIQIVFIITLSALFLYDVVLYVWQFKKFKINFSFLKNFKYDAIAMLSSIFMAIIYFFGYQTVFIAGEEYLVALNVASIATDAQWDSMGAISTVAKVDISKNRYQYKKELRNAYIFTAILILTSICLSIGLSFFYHATLTLVLVYLAFQIVDMLLSPVQEILEIYIQLEYSVVLTSCIFLISKGARVLISVFLISAFCADIAQVVESILLLSVVVVRFVIYKLENGKLVLKRTNKLEDMKTKKEE